MPSGEKAAQTSAGGDGAPPLPLNVVSQAAAAAEGNAEDEARQQGSHGRPANEPVTQDTVDDEPPPPYGDNLFEINQDDDGTGVDTKATLNADGRIDIRINQHTSRLSAIFTPALQTQLAQQDQEPLPPPYIPPSLGGQPGQSPPPPMNVVIHVVGSRGDVQPFVALGKVLKETYGHRVRLATHPTFQQFVTENGLEFFSIGGDPAKLMAFMVKNPGLMPGFDVITSGDVGQRRKEIYQMIRGCWRSCIETGDGTGVAASDATTEDWMSSSSDNSGNPPDPGLKPFIADAIIANPPSFAHVHCAEKLGCPLHVMFTMPYSPTQAFPHPLANIQSSNADPNMTNFLTYGLVDMMTWQGLGDLVNRFRQKSLGLEPISLMFAPGMLARLRIPHTYCWSPALIPKPKDWSNHISISGFYFLSLASNFTPEPELANFLAAGPPPVYIGFGSIVVDDPNAMTEMIFDAVRKTGQRALVSKGWGGIGADELGIPEGVMMLGNVPHDWLFNHVSAVVHHGGAGTTAAGIAAAKPTVIVPFFGDQPFWGAMIAKAGAGPDSIAYKDLDADKLAASITFALKPETLERTKELATRIKHEDGCQNGAQSFHQQMHVDTVRCSLAPSRCAVWHLKKTNVRLSALAATVLANQGLLDFKDLKLFRSNEYETEAGPTDPITGGASALIGTGSSIFMGFSDFPAEAMKAMNLHPASKKKGKQKENPQKAEGDSTTGSGSMTPTVVGSQDGSRDDLDSESVADTQISDDKSLVTAPTQPTSPLSSSASQSTFNLGESLAGMHDPASDNPEPTGKEKEALSPSSTRRGSSLFDALGDELARRMNPPQPGQQGRPSASPLERKYSETLDTVLGTSKGVSRMLEAGLRSPMDFTHSLARGFHNAPKLYGDDTVRKQEQITDFKSGLRAAGKGFGLGLYDGISGLVTQPMSGAKKEGMAGFIKGVGKGIGGIILKPQAAVFGLPGYMMKGVYAEISAISGKSTQNYIIAARTAQGYEDYHNSNAQERNDIERRWRELQLAIKKKKNVDDVLREWGQTSKSEGKESKAQSSARRAETRKKIFDHLERTDFRSLMQNRPGSGAGSSHADGPAAQGSNSSDVPRLEQQPATPSDVDVLTPVTSRDEPGTANSSALGTTTTIHHPGDASVVARHTRSAQVPGGSDDADLEAAIRASLAQASTGSADDDAALEAAIRASVAQLEHGSPAVTAAFDAARNEHEEGAAIDAALQASLLEYERTRGSGAGATTGAHGDSTGAVPTEAPPPYDDAVDDDGEVAEAIKRSLAEHRMDKRSPIDNDNSSSSVSASAPADGPAPASGSAPAPAAATSRGDRADEHEAEVERAIQASLAESKTHDRERTEEEIVLEYVKRQSLLEEEHRRRATGGGGVGPGGDGAGQGSAGASSSGGGSKS